jgi:hypothetical protein
VSDAFAMIETCALHQLPADPEMLRTLTDGQGPIVRGMPRPNLVVRTGVPCEPACPDDCDRHHGLSLPALSLRRG